MVLGILTSVAACPAIIGTTEAVRHGQRSNAKDRHRGQKSNLIASCPIGSRQNAYINGRAVILNNNKLYINAASGEDSDLEKPAGHLFAGYFLEHPDFSWRWQGEGLVSTIMDDPPQLNWVYVDKDTSEIKYGNKVESDGQIMGPWSCTKLDKRTIFQGWEGFMAVQEDDGRWALYFDVDDNSLKGKPAEGKRMLEIELARKERRKTKASAEDKEYI